MKAEGWKGERAKKRGVFGEDPSFLCGSVILLTDTELFLGDDCTVAVDVLADEVVEKATTLTYECFQCAGCGVVLVVLFKVLSEVSDTDREKRDLAFGATCICGTLSVSFEDFLLFFC